MRILIFKNYERLCDWTARYIADKINAFNPTSKKPFVLGLPTGSSSLGIYGGLVRLFNERYISFSDVVTFNMDEYAGLPKNHPQSYHFFMDQNFFRHIDIRRENINIPDGTVFDLEKECLQYEEKINVYGGIDLFLGGIGTNGHIAFNEPGSAFESLTRVVTLADETLKANSRFFGGESDKVPKTALTVGIQTIMKAAEVVLVASGAQKAEALQHVVEGETDALFPASALRLHPSGIIVCDEEATQNLKPETLKFIENPE